MRAWLKSVSNRPSGRTEGAEEQIRRRFFDGGRLKQIPARRSRREIVLRILARSFEAGRDYKESEVNEILSGFHGDFCTLRRELIMAKLLTREKGTYRRNPAPPSGEEARAEEDRPSG
ncbi:MAG: DUF2087 domain-containing protein [Candidatus Eisenbacteria bacterium]|nr:DUF2087 domain-containing protein [Candidatus Eisenbacteria bacterium]